MGSARALASGDGALAIANFCIFLMNVSTLNESRGDFLLSSYFFSTVTRRNVAGIDVPS